MKILIFLIMQSTFQFNLEDLLGKDIKDVSIGKLEKRTIEENNYFLTDYTGHLFKKVVGQIIITTDKKNRIQSVFVFFEERLTKFFSEEISNQYGLDYDVLVLDKLNYETTTSTVKDEFGFEQKLTQTETILKKGQVKDDDVAVICWEKKEFKLVFHVEPNFIQFIKK